MAPPSLRYRCLFLKLSGHNSSITATPCDRDGNFLAPNTPPPREAADDFSWVPFHSNDEFELADLLFRRAEMSKSNINDLLHVLKTRATREGGTVPFKNCDNLHSAIDSITEGEVPWNSFSVQYNGPRPEMNVPQWMDEKYQVYYRNPHEVVKSMLMNKAFDGNFDYTPYRQYENGQRVWRDFMSGNFGWKQAVRILFISMLHNVLCNQQLPTRTRLVRTLRLTARCWYQSTSAVTKPPPLSQLDKMNFTHYTSHLETSRTTQGKATKTPLCSSDFLLFQRVCLTRTNSPLCIDSRD